MAFEFPKSIADLPVTNPKWIGRQVKRVEDPQLITGRAEFIDNVTLPGMLHCAILHSPHPHARITSVDMSRAAALPGVVATLTGEDAERWSRKGYTTPEGWGTYVLATDKVRLLSPGTDLEFSIRDLPVRPCNGQRNIPDGEVFTAPVRDSINGVIRYNAASRYQGTVFSDIEFMFKDGQIVRATCSGDEAKLNKILDADEGARYIGEWSIGCNNHVRRPMLDTLFDEKIGGSIHLTPGAAYDECDNGNRSRVHWDLVLIQTPEYGGGELYFDGVLVRKDGKFLPDDLQGLNEGL